MPFQRTGLAATDQVRFSATTFAGPSSRTSSKPATSATRLSPCGGAAAAEATWDNMQWSGSLGMHDLALGYYDGRFDFPVAASSTTLKS